MPEETVRRTDLQVARWALMALLVIGCLIAYFRYAPKVPTVIHPLPVVEDQ